MADNSSQIIEDIKWFMFDDESKEIKNEKWILSWLTVCKMDR